MGAAEAVQKFKPIENQVNRESILDIHNFRIYNKKHNCFIKLKLPYKFISPSVHVLENTFLIGGGVYPYDKCFSVNIIDLKVSFLANLCQGRIKHTVVFIKNCVFAIGGLGKTPLKSVENFYGISWKLVKSMNFCRIDPSACVYNQEI